MDIWRWVGQVGYDLRDAGHHRLAEIIDDLPPAVCYGRHEAAEAMVPEGLALARGLDLPWVEVFLRHWLAQSRLAHRRDVSSGLAEVIDLLDFAHQESARECPQSICVTQDVCIAYGALDGPGYGEERLAAAVEAMARIDVSWPCFGCISSEQASALLDLDRFAEAEAFCRAQIATAAKAGQSRPGEVTICLAEALLAQGEYEEMLALVRRRQEFSQTTSIKQRRQILECIALAKLGRLEQALKENPKPTRLDPSQYAYWSRLQLALCERRAELNTPALDQTLDRYRSELESNGALFDQAEISAAAAKLAWMRQDHARVARYLAIVDDLLPRLKRPKRIIELADELRKMMS